MVYFCSFHNANLTIKDKSVDGVLGTRTRSGRMDVTDVSTELSMDIMRFVVQLVERTLFETRYPRLV